MVIYYLLLFAACTAIVSNSIDPGTQANISTALDTATYFIQDTVKHYKELTKALKELDKSNLDQLFSKQQKALTIVKILGPIMKRLLTANAVGNFIFTFFMPTELEEAMEVIKKRFDEVNRKLDEMSSKFHSAFGICFTIFGTPDKMDRLTVEIKSSVVLHTFLVNYADWENDIENAAVKLRQTRKGFSTTADQRARLKLAQDFINYYDTAKIDGRMLNIFRAVHDSSTITHKNIFQLFIDEHGCDVGMLTKLFAHLQNLYTLAAEQTDPLNYRRIQEFERKAKQIYDNMYDMRYSLDEFVHKCHRDSVSYARKEVVAILDNNPNGSPSDLAPEILEHLSILFPWYSWGVAFTKDTINERPKYRSKQVIELENKGEIFFKILKHGEKERNMIVLWQYVNEDPKCVGRDNSNVVVFYVTVAILIHTRRGRAFTLQFIKVFGICSENILSKSSCNNGRFKAVNPDDYNVINFYFRPVFLRFYDTYQWIAGIQRDQDPCTNSNTCKNGGICRTIPATTEFQCTCRKFYDGDQCETKFSVDDEFNDLIATLRKDFGITTGMPTAVDLYFELRDVSQKLDSILQSIKDTVAFTNVLVQHSQVIHSANYLAKKYALLSRDEISVSDFVRVMERFLRTESFDYIYGRLHEIITGEGFLDSGHLVEEYKSYIASSDGNYVCTTKYANKIDDMSNNLLLLDHAIMEAYLVFLQMKSVSAPENTKTILFAEAKQFSNAARTRAKEYLDLWHNTSCPMLQTDGMINNACNDMSSNLGMTVKVRCSSDRTPAQFQVKCMMDNDTLKWDAEPSCNFFWTEWNSWGACSRSCDRGVQHRHRACSGFQCQGESNESRPCNSQQCCQAHDGKYECSNDTCINKSQLCDGNDDCGNGADESRSQCPDAIYSGDMIALKNRNDNNFLSCYCSVSFFCWSWRYKCTIRNCPGHRMDGRDWNKCFGERFLIFAKGRGTNQPIRSGDSVSFQYDSGLWLSCGGRGDYCTTHGCPGYRMSFTEGCPQEEFNIYAPGRLGTCKGDAKDLCYGKPIMRGDTVFILAYRGGEQFYWLGDRVRPQTCTGKNIASDDVHFCSKEAWKIFPK